MLKNICWKNKKVYFVIEAVRSLEVWRLIKLVITPFRCPKLKFSQNYKDFSYLMDIKKAITFQLQVLYFILGRKENLQWVSLVFDLLLGLDWGFHISVTPP